MSFQSFKFQLFLECTRASSYQSYLTLGNSLDYTPPVFSVYGNFQARILEWVAIFFSKGSFQPRIEPRLPTLQANPLPQSHWGSPISNHPNEIATACIQMSHRIQDPFKPTDCSENSYEKIKNTLLGKRASQVALVVKNLPASAGDMRHGFDRWLRKIPWRAWQSIPVFLSREALWTEKPDGLQSTGSQKDRSEAI